MTFECLACGSICGDWETGYMTCKECEGFGYWVDEDGKHLCFKCKGKGCIKCDVCKGEGVYES